MNQRSHLTVVAAVATLMASLPLEALFLDWAWLFQAVFTIALVCGALVGARALRTPVWAQPLVGFVALVFAITWSRGKGHAFGGIFPDVDTVRYFGSLVSSAGTDMRQLTIPVGNTDGLLFLTTAGIGVCYVLVDMFAAGIRRPALAGLPMLAIYAVPVEIDPKSLSLFTFAIGACGFLWLLVSDSIDRVRLFGRRFTGDGHGVDSWESSPLASVGRRITAVGVLLAIIVPAALPGVGKGFLGKYGHGGNGGDGVCVAICSGSGTGLDLFANLAGKLNNGTPVDELTVQTDDPFPYYLRLSTADVLTTKGFRPNTESGGPLGRDLPLPAIQGLTFTKHTAQVKIQHWDKALLPIYREPITGTIAGINDGWSYDAATDTVFSASETAAGLKYSFAFNKPDWDRDALRTAPPLPPNTPLMQSDATVPETVPQVLSIVTDAERNSTNEYDTVLALVNSLSAAKGFSYKLSTQSGTTGTDIGNFLQQKKGYCVQYAAALAWLVRAAHFPARVAFGFTQGTAIDTGSGVTYELTTLNLHAWTEVYFQNFGWVPFDATPSSNIVGSVRNAWEQDSGNGGVTIPRKSPSAAASGGSLGGVGKTARPTGGPGSGNHGAGGGNKPTPVWVWWTLAGLLVVLLALASPAVARAILRGRRISLERRRSADNAEPGEPWVVIDDESRVAATKRRVHAAWAEFMDTLVDFDVLVDPSESPHMTAERVIRTTDLTDDAVAGTRVLGEAEQQIRYARRPAPSPSLEPELRRFRRELASNVSFSTRLRAICLPPSVVARWNALAADAFARGSARIQAVRDGFGRMTQTHRWMSAPRRLLAGRSGR